MKRIILLLTISAFMFSCKVTKDVATEKIIVDSSYKRKFDSSIAVNSRMKSSYERQITDLKKNKVQFQKCPPCPAVHIDSTCNKDSMVKIIRQLEAIVASQKQKIKINADGSIEAEGQIASISADMQKIESENHRLDMELAIKKQYTDSLEQQVTHLKQASQSHTKRSLLNFWWLLVIGLVGGWVIRSKIKL